MVVTVSFPVLTAFSLSEILRCSCYCTNYLSDVILYISLNLSYTVLFASSKFIPFLFKCTPNTSLSQGETILTRPRKGDEIDAQKLLAHSVDESKSRVTGLRMVYGTGHRLLHVCRLKEHFKAFAYKYGCKAQRKQAFTHLGFLHIAISAPEGKKHSIRWQVLGLTRHD